MILIDGVKYKLWVPENEKQLEEMVKEHFNDIFGEYSLYFDIKPELRSKAGIGSKPDGIAIVFDKPCFYVVEIERAEHGVHDHVVTQISKFNTALKKTGTRMKIAEAIYSEIASDPFKQFFAKSKVKGELYKFLTDLFLYRKPIIIVIIIDEAIDELKEAIEELPLQSKIVEFKTFERVGVGLGVHAHLFEPIIEKEKAPPTPEAPRAKRERMGPSDSEIPQAMAAFTAEGKVITSTLLRDHFQTKTRQVIRTAMKGLAKAGKVKIERVGEEGKRKRYEYKLV